MDIKQLKFLVALERTRHFGLAATDCHVTQPTLSMRLRDLEDELGLELIRRNQRFLGFTPAGERILAWAHNLLDAEAGLYAEAAACRGQLVGTLRLGVVPLAGLDPIRLVELLFASHPQMRFQLFALSSEQILEQLTRNQLDLGLAYIERLATREHFTVHSLEPTAMGLLHDTRHFKFDSTGLGWQAVAELPLGLLSAGMHFRQSIDHAFRQRALKPQLRLETDSIFHLLQAVGAGLCCGVVPLDASLQAHDEHLRLVPIEDAHTLAPLSLIMARGAPRSPLAEACFEDIRNNLAQALQGDALLPR